MGIESLGKSDRHAGPHRAPVKKGHEIKVGEEPHPAGFLYCILMRVVISGTGVCFGRAVSAGAGVSAVLQQRLRRAARSRRPCILCRSALHSVLQFSRDLRGRRAFVLLAAGIFWLPRFEYGPREAARPGERRGRHRPQDRGRTAAKASSHFGKSKHSLHPSNRHPLRTAVLDHPARAIGRRGQRRLRAGWSRGSCSFRLIPRLRSPFPGMPAFSGSPRAAPGRTIEKAYGVSARRSRR